VKRARVLLAAGLILVSYLAAPPAISWLRGAESLPEALSDQEFWALSSTLSEPGGSFRSDNLLSNELGFPFIVADLAKGSTGGRVYMGVGPEQNFNYIAALQPRMAFIVDIRRANLDLQLMYKALFELSADRADFVSRLFSKRRPATLNALSTPDQMFRAFGAMDKSEELKNANLLALKATLVATHQFALDAEDWKNISDAYSAFYTFGPEIRYSSTQRRGFGGFNQPTYADLMTAVDGEGHSRSYLATEENFKVLKNLESKNLVVPVVGNFGGPKAIRAVGQYVKEHGSVVSTFYLSNVEMYLLQQNLWNSFCRNVASLPLGPDSRFIRSARGAGYGRGSGLDLTLAEMEPEVRNCR
jgi:hypothetical protein